MENNIGFRIVQNGDTVLKVFVPDDDRIQGVNSFQDRNKVLAVSRVMVAWQLIGLSMGICDMCHRYLKERKRFGVPLAAFQSGKSNSCLVAKAFCDLEPIYTLEGTYDIINLVTGREVTGFASFNPAAQKSRL
ncbi:unnamed protein product [Sphenostylis stenocarpa]|uniref:Acyl-CoA dehydrogenase/oxidase C-terminal domain-containing protein n=1 Tax=Sphenostylis stenocarpa TaxID=92480 RepID=A0AA86RTY0_9FABA|nr:unnamed protein product [Sphenostylis stenocarpa]